MASLLPFPKVATVAASASSRKLTNRWLDRASMATVMRLARCLAAGLLVALTACGRPPLPATANDAGPPATGADATLLQFQPVAPCLDEAAYTGGTRTVTFGFLGMP